MKQQLDYLKIEKQNFFNFPGIAASSIRAFNQCQREEKMEPIETRMKKNPTKCQHSRKKTGPNTGVEVRLAVKVNTSTNGLLNLKVEICFLQI